MEEIKLEIKNNTLTIEGEFDIELDLNTIHFGYPPEDEKLFDRTAFEIRSYGEINLKFLSDLVRYVNMKSASRTPSEWPRWRLTFERLYKEDCVCEMPKSRHQYAMEDFKDMRFY